jgi:predicted SAM-dependent methyltransferase
VYFGWHAGTFSVVHLGAPMAPVTKQPAVLGEPAEGPRKAVYRAAHTVFGRRTLQLMWFDVLRLKARLRHVGQHDLTPPHAQLHLGSGSRRVAGWLNVDVAGSDYDIDFTKRLPWKTGSFSAVVSQHVIEHFELFGELLPLLSELRRVLLPGGEIWLSCPDMEKICRFYVDGRAGELVARRVNRSGYSTRGAPAQQVINDYFHQLGEHKNLFDFEMVRWALESAGFTDVRGTDEGQLLERFPGFPSRQDELHTLYVTARVPSCLSRAATVRAAG